MARAEGPGRGQRGVFFSRNKSMLVSEGAVDASGDSQMWTAGILEASRRGWL